MPITVVSGGWAVVIDANYCSLWLVGDGYKCQLMLSLEVGSRYKCQLL